MPTRKQRRRELKTKRHEQAWYEIDEFGNEVELDAEALKEEKEKEPPRERTNGSKPASGDRAAAAKKQPAGRAMRQPPAPSWGRAVKRSALLGVVILVLFSFSAKGNLVRVVPTAVLFAAAYVPLMYYIDRFAYRRWQARQQGAATPAKSRPAKKR